jgi:hypothetical protein
MVDCRHPFLTLLSFAPNVKLFHLPVTKDIRKIAASLVYIFRKIKYDLCHCARYSFEERSKNGGLHGLAFGHTRIADRHMSARVSICVSLRRSATMPN